MSNTAQILFNTARIKTKSQAALIRRFAVIPGEFLVVVALAVDASYSSALAQVAIQSPPSADTRTATQPASAAPILTHRYSFDKDASDSVGHAEGTLRGTAIKVNDI